MEVILPERKKGADMLRHFGLIYMFSGVGLLLRRLRMEDRSADNIRRAAEKGPLVYILYARSRLDWLALNRTLNMRRLPLARSVVSSEEWLRGPSGRAGQRQQHSREGSPEGGGPHHPSTCRAARPRRSPATLWRVGARLCLWFGLNPLNQILLCFAVYL